jgi:hypothetical protein
MKTKLVLFTYYFYNFHTLSAGILQFLVNEVNGSIINALDILQQRKNVGTVEV